MHPRSNSSSNAKTCYRIKESTASTEEVHANLNVHSICSDYRVAGSELKSVLEEFCKLRSTYLEYQTHQRFMDLARKEDPEDESRDDVDEAIAVSKEKLSIVEKKSDELADKVQSMMTKIRNITGKFSQNTNALASIENIVKHVEGMEHEMSKGSDNGVLTPLALRKRRKGTADEGVDAAAAAEFCHKKAAEISENAEQRVKEATETRTRAEKLRHTVTSLEEQVAALRQQLRSGDESLRRQRSRLAASNESEVKCEAEVKICRERSQNVAEECNKNRMESERLEKEISEMSTMSEAKRQKLSATLSVLEQVHGFKVEGISSASGESEPSVEMSVRLAGKKGPRLTMIVAKSSGSVSRVLDLEEPDIVSSSGAAADLPIQGRDFYANDLFTRAVSGGFSSQWLAQQVAERWVRHCELIQEMRMCERLHDLTTTAKAKTTTMIFSFPYAVANGLKITCDVPMDYPSPQSLPIVLNVQCGDSYSNGDAVAADLHDFFRRDMPRSLTAILERASKV
eukprot:g3491.t1